MVYNGVTDWLYEGEMKTRAKDVAENLFAVSEEVLYTDSAIWVSPGLSLFAFASFNDSSVSEYLIPSMTGRWSPVSLRYPRAGGVNPEVSLTVMQLLNTGRGKQWNVQPPIEVFNR